MSLAILPVAPGRRARGAVVGARVAHWICGGSSHVSRATTRGWLESLPLHSWKSFGVRVILAPTIGVLVLAATATGQNISQLYKQVAPSVVVVDAGDDGLGSGVIVDSDGLIATNQHVVGDSDTIRVRYLNGTSELAVVLYTNVARDLAILWVRSRQSPAKLGDSDQVEVGERVVAIGAPRGLAHTLSEGIISGIRVPRTGRAYLQTTVPLSPGSSGGPIINMRGEVIGLAVFVLRDSQNLNFAIPSSDVRTALLHGRSELHARRERLAREERERLEASRRAEEEQRRRAEEAERRRVAIEAERKAKLEAERQRAAVEPKPEDPSENPLSGRRFSLLTPHLEVPPLPGPKSPSREESIEAYRKEVLRRIDEKWVYPPEALRKGQSGNGQAKIVIWPEGTVKSIEIVQSTGVMVLDKYFENAIRMAAPFPPVPDAAQNEPVTFTPTFAYQLPRPGDGSIR